MININPAISVIVPVYKVEKFLHRCIDSILAQTFSNFELILVDDGSPDNCGSICDEYSSKDGRIRVIHKENGGVSSARNAALDIAVGKYVMFCDSDDYVALDWCEQMNNAISLYPAAWINCNIYSVDFDGSIKMRYLSDNDSDLYIQKGFYDIYTLSLSGALWNKIYSNKIIQEYHIRFNETYKIGEDTDFNIQYYKHCNNIIFVSSPLYYYCQNSESAINSYKYDSFDQYRHTFFDRLPYIEDKYMDDYLDSWLYTFVKMLDNAFDSRNQLGFLQKIRYNQKMMQTEEFRYCIKHAPGKKESPLFKSIVKLHNYYIFWLFQKLCKLKNKLNNR